MNERLSEIIQYRTGGRQVQFAALMNWSPQYLSKLLRGENFGLAPVVSILQTLPEINARWLLLGEGEMLSHAKLGQLRDAAVQFANAILDLEKYLPVMSPSELHEFERACIDKTTPNFSNEQIATWQQLLAAREKELNAKFQNALCKQPKAKK